MTQPNDVKTWSRWRENMLEMELAVNNPVAPHRDIAAFSITGSWKIITQIFIVWIEFLGLFGELDGRKVKKAEQSVNYAVAMALNM